MHTATLWQIALAADTTFSTPIASVFSGTFLTTIPFIDGLMVATDYIARSKYYDNLGNESAWSASIPFTTLAADLLPPPGTFEEATAGCGSC